MKLNLPTKGKSIALPIIILVGLLALILFRDILIFGIFLIAMAIFNHYQNKYQLGFDVSPTLVLTIIFSMRLGFGYGLAFLFLGGVIPNLITGGFTGGTVFFIGIAVLVAYLASLGLIANVLLYGIGLLVLQSFLGLMISLLLSDSLVLFSVFFGFALNAVYFLVFNNILTLVLT
ncbi:hypothetical protein A3K63_04290 [Candidatus Micrarchaeota archaeon RBG_16_49_10]|nr:MAG: hypothetical protein A3K63_04290 [Candidatus Micrarchaeota archaeon RBG_16_49_10]